MRLTMPEPEIDLYNEGFNGNCQLGRVTDGKKLSELVEMISEPMVVALDAPWGAGKSFFLKCWVGSHEIGDWRPADQQQNENARTVYFDAFQNDFVNQPLVSIVGAVADRIGENDPAKSNWEHTKRFAFTLAKPAFNFSLALATGGLMTVSGDAVDHALKSGQKSLKEASEEFWDKEAGLQQAMVDFRSSLAQFAATRKLVIVVDELDRCRPDYALDLLEVIKHFFSIPNVHFVLGVNLEQLANSVRARYGQGVNAERYLHKFVTLTMPLVPPQTRLLANSVQIRHLQNVAHKIGLDGSWKLDWLSEYIGYIDHHAGLSLRDIENIATLAMVSSDPPTRPEANLHLYFGTIILKIMSPQAILQARNGNLQSAGIFSVLNLATRPKNGSSSTDDAHAVWALVAAASDNFPDYIIDEVSRLFGDMPPRDALRSIIAKTLDTFHIGLG